MPNNKSLLRLQFLEKRASPVKEVINKVRGADLPIEFDLKSSRCFRIGNQAAVLLFNREIFQDPSDLSHLAKRTTILAVVAFSSGGGSEYAANRMVVLEPEK